MWDFSECVIVIVIVIVLLRYWNAEDLLHPPLPQAPPQALEGRPLRQFPQPSQDCLLAIRRTFDRRSAGTDPEFIMPRNTNLCTLVHSVGPGSHLSPWGVVRLRAAMRRSGSFTATCSCLQKKKSASGAPFDTCSHHNKATSPGSWHVPLVTTSRWRHN